MAKIKWYLAAFLVGAILGAGAVLFFMLRPASTTITELRAESDRAARQYQDEAAKYSDLLADARGRAGELAEDLARATEERRADLEGAARMEDQAQSLQKLIGEIQESDERASGYNRAIRDEAESASVELREYRETLEGSTGSGGE